LQRRAGTGSLSTTSCTNALKLPRYDRLAPAERRRLVSPATSLLKEEEALVEQLVS